MREKALSELRKLLITDGVWVNDEVRDLRAIWEGLFFSKYPATASHLREFKSNKILAISSEI